MKLLRLFSIAATATALLFSAAAAAQEPIKIGCGMALTGGLAANGKAALIAMEIWADDVNARGGLLGRQVKLICYDDQTNPATIPGIYTKLLDVDKVDLVVSGYGTNLIAPAMPIVMQRNLMFMALFGLDVNAKFKYDRYFQIMPAGPEPAVDWSRGFFEAAMALTQPVTVALVAPTPVSARGASASTTPSPAQGRLRQDLSPNTVDTRRSSAPSRR
jgi:branched-chain amino acid transport system substrate-binding protein